MLLQSLGGVEGLCVFLNTRLAALIASTFYWMNLQY
jgi:hypothetical protein